MDYRQKWHLFIESERIGKDEECGFIQYLKQLGYPDDTYCHCRLTRLEEYLTNYRCWKKLISLKGGGG